MKTLRASFVVAILLAFGFQSAGTAVAQTEIVRVQFARGTTGAVYTGRLGSSEAVRYVLGANAEQFLTVSLRPDNQLTYFILYAPDGSIMYESSQAGPEYYGQLWQSGDHVIEVFYNGNVGTFSNFDVAFEVTALAATPPAASDPVAIDVQACLAAVAAQTNNTVTLLSAEFSEANTLVMVGVGPQLAPWRCLSSHGVVAEVMFAGDEGRL